MTKRQIAGVTIDVDDEGYLIDHSQWNRDVAVALAADEGIELAAGHWKALEFIDRDFREKGAVPGMRRMCRLSTFMLKPSR
jgi:TusE/DsrC/DsvC family sulfur relay protein